jgi:hypothetical protein
MPHTKFSTKIKHKDLKTIFIEFNNDSINLNPEYQRKVVWGNQKMKGFLNSCYRGIIPVPLIMSTSKDYDICVDGKQRISTLIKFFNNDISFKIDEDDTDEYFYDCINEEYEDKEGYYILSKEDRLRMDKLEISIVEYQNLSYEDQSEIFYRIQQGIALKPGEIIISMFKDTDLAKSYSDECDGKLEYLSQFYTNDRKEHIYFITNLLMIIHTKKLIMPKGPQRKKFIASLDNTRTISKHFKKMGKLLESVFNDSLLNSPSFEKKNFTKNIRFTLLYYIFTKHPNYDFDMNIMKMTIKKVRARCFGEHGWGSKSSDKALNEIYDDFDEIYYKLLSKIGKLKTGKDDDEEEEDEEEDGDSDLDNEGNFDDVSDYDSE